MLQYAGNQHLFLDVMAKLCFQIFDSLLLKLSKQNLNVIKEYYILNFSVSFYYLTCGWNTGNTKSSEFKVGEVFNGVGEIMA